MIKKIKKLIKRVKKYMKKHPLDMAAVLNMVVAMLTIIEFIFG